VETHVDYRPEYTCPMHPQIRKSAPGNCPICGMLLEPVEIQITEEDNSEYRLMRKRFFISAFLSWPLLFITMGMLMFADELTSGIVKQFPSKFE